MNLAHIAGYAGALFTGLILGLLGGGGALLSIPVLVYLFGIEPAVATGYSLFLIGVSALSGAAQNVRKKQIDYNAAIWYGIPSVITVYITRRLILPSLPAKILTIGNWELSKGHLILLILCIVMFMAAYRMIGSASAPDEEERKIDHLRLAFYAVLIGGFLGLVGGGGGFLMVPALIYFANVSTKKAIGTSLMLVSVNSFIGFLGDVGSHNKFDWKFLFLFTFIATVGVLTGHQLVGRFDNNRLRRYFGWFIFVVATFMIGKEVFFA